MLPAGLLLSYVTVLYVLLYEACGKTSEYCNMTSLEMFAIRTVVWEGNKYMMNLQYVSCPGVVLFSVQVIHVCFIKS